MPNPTRSPPCCGDTVCQPWPSHMEFRLNASEGCHPKQRRCRGGAGGRKGRTGSTRRGRPSASTVSCSATSHPGRMFGHERTRGPANVMVKARSLCLCRRFGAMRTICAMHLLIVRQAFSLGRFFGGRDKSDNQASLSSGVLMFQRDNRSERSTHFSLLMEYFKKFFQFHPGLPSLSHAGEEAQRC